METKGKNFSCNNEGKRRKSDFYETPYSLTHHLMDREDFDYSKLVCEPACGGGAISHILKDKFDNVVEYDVERDFLTVEDQYDYIITNPPFSLAFQFTEHAKKLAKDKFIFLLPLSYLHGKKRYDSIYMDKSYPLKKIHVFTRYPLLGDPLRPDGKYRTGMMVYAWFVFERGYDGPPTIEWIDNNSDVIKKGDCHNLPIPELINQTAFEDFF